ncbi:Tfp pilus assembly protein FimT/FimU [Neptuniibacter sp. QD37_11]|uniref:pilus assembly FimT family protein n=1 Tax=Neptuniibacter sp. QD37_11 TaxID=3398209 RepID=UPI0039F559D8
MKNPNNKQSGFTMIELIVVMVIMAIMYAMTMPHTKMMIRQSHLTTLMSIQGVVHNIASLSHTIAIVEAQVTLPKVEIINQDALQNIQQTGGATTRSGFIRTAGEPLATSGIYTDTPISYLSQSGGMMRVKRYDDDDYWDDYFSKGKGKGKGHKDHGEGNGHGHDKHDGCGSGKGHRYDDNDDCNDDDKCHGKKGHAYGKDCDDDDDDKCHGKKGHAYGKDCDDDGNGGNGGNGNGNGGWNGDVPEWKFTPGELIIPDEIRYPTGLQVGLVGGFPQSQKKNGRNGMADVVLALGMAESLKVQYPNTKTMRVGYNTNENGCYVEYIEPDSAIENGLYTVNVEIDGC